MRLPLAFLLGVATAVLVACGGGSNKKLLPVVSADRLKNDLADIRNAVDANDCAAATRALDSFNSDLQKVPPNVDVRLRARLQQGANKLAVRVPIDCRPQTTQTTTTPPTTTATTPTTTTTTTPTTTTTTTTTTTPPPSTTTTTPPPTDTSGGSGGVTAP